MRISLLKIFSSLISFLLFTSITQAQNFNIEKFQYLSPVPGSKLNSAETNIIIRFGEAFVNNSFDDCLIVKGNKSGLHSGNVILAENNKTLLFRPDQEFADGEMVTVELRDNLKTVSNVQVPELYFWFETSEINLNKIIRADPQKYSELLFPEYDSPKNFPQPNNDFSGNNAHKTYSIQQDELPGDFPLIFVDSINNPSPGYIFLAPFSTANPSTENYIIITDNYGIPIFYRKMDSDRGMDFKKQESGVLTYYNGTKSYVMDSSYNVIDSLYMDSSYVPDVHDCLLLENGHSLLFSYDYQQVAMDTVVVDGDSNATVAGLVIQELDENKNALFQWRSWDHFKITDATGDIDLTAPNIDYIHCNSIELDNDGNILISCRHMDEVTKINRKTGEIIWRLGGEYCENNQFTFLNDLIGFSHQHDVRRLPNGNITLFDNGNLHSPSFSRAVEYEIDEINKTVTLVWEYRNNPQTYSVAMGNSQTLDNQNVIIGWGWESLPAIREVTRDKDVKLSFSIAKGMVNYRGFKYQWETNLFVTNPDSLLFGEVSVGDSLSLPLDIINNSDQEISINGLLNRDAAFYVNTQLPVTISPYGTSNIEVTFKPTEKREYVDDLYLQWNKENERISQVVPMRGITNSVVPVELTTFTASVANQIVTLKWTTATETNNLGFGIERKDKKIEWLIRGFVEGRGTAAEENIYTFKDQVEPGNYSYRLKQVDFNGTFKYSNIIVVNVNNPVEYSLDQNYPNPFNPQTEINYSLAEDSFVTLKVFNIVGEKVATLINKRMRAGNYSITWEASHVPSGVYFYKLAAGDYSDVKKMLLLK